MVKKVAKVFAVAGASGMLRPGDEGVEVVAARDARYAEVLYLGVRGLVKGTWLFGDLRKHLPLLAEGFVLGEDDEGGVLVEDAEGLVLRIPAWAPREERPDWLPDLSSEKRLGRFALTGDAGKMLAEAFADASEVAAREEYRAIFQGTQVEASPDGMRVVASDGYRLYFRDLPIRSVGKYLFVMHHKSVLPRLVVHAEEVVVEMGEKKPIVRVIGNGWRADLQGMEGEYPDYMRVFNGFKPVVRIRLWEGAARIIRAAIPKDLNKRVDLLLEDSGAVMLKSEQVPATSIGHWEWGVPENERPITTRNEDDKFFVAFNGKYLSDGLEITGGDTLEIGARNTSNFLNKKGWEWTMAKVEGKGTYVLAPLRV